jgi:hypothetical protein
MTIRSTFTAFRPAHLLSFLPCVVSLLILLAFPLRSAHQYAKHYRSSEILQTIEHNPTIAHRKAGPAARIAHQTVLPILQRPIDSANVVGPVSSTELLSPVPLSLLLSRLRLCSSRSGGPDPLL